ncbi:hypothetical protein [Chryseobacterium viscerum]|uniref:Uncharacterized protein n=1 Tax=Chryseobacterium viscerum TaxID=1037377 RepID=A0A316WIN4_9FLAO|nr:hypothetical protein [Chryseobacterium viscerum]PWN59008.1 hypothetical protein C1634_020560 [Chryseobacterium viscerum]
MNNEKLLNQLENQENIAKENAEAILKNTNSKIFKSLFEFWQGLNRELALEEMFLEFKENISKFWINPKFNKDLNQSFNMILFSHSGVYGGGLEAFALNFQNDSNDFPRLETMDSRIEYLENISSLEAFTIFPLNEFTMKIQGEENNFDDWDDLMTMYTLYEATAHILAYKVFSKTNQENIFQLSFRIEKPFYLTISEHDSGSPDKIIYLIE